MARAAFRFLRRRGDRGRKPPARRGERGAPRRAGLAAPPPPAASPPPRAASPVAPAPSATRARRQPARGPGRASAEAGPPDPQTRAGQAGAIGRRKGHLFSGKSPELGRPASGPLGRGIRTDSRFASGINQRGRPATRPGGRMKGKRMEGSHSEE
ncbi:sterile alpha motif domain-containing protein 1-like [Lemur catta]|uniref:sterile alpha motif domain-containing protein 1-like n=1 Tax=Lemur catta TaxID=9447 RepID=UPI001E26E423|nr:sterile alpha motif domain-containing protein 1-like [Lemur catta]